ncbi:helix-turn-helix domain-containing protein [Comamonas flocculans]|uniref:Uncharacterized protein n=1 Tax=Comamonas flocculans TaxID=2597701 RepID=A0A5B8S0E7_9BURK|nr:hypothetical protein [Comamonas flocculans]QEA13777.1 hypothetical protein FOZ74_12445 [Comamonas flocculans]
MQKKELAELLGISASMVSRLAKRGMPTDTIERATRWRNRHLEPSRVKGNRPDQKAAPAQGAPRPIATRKDAPGAGIDPAALRAALELAGRFMAGHLSADPMQRQHELRPLRELLARLPLASAMPLTFPAALWWHLCGHFLLATAPLHDLAASTAPLSLDEAALFSVPGAHLATPGELYRIACDPDGGALETLAGDGDCDADAEAALTATNR